MNNIKAVIFDWGRTIYDKDHEQLFPDTKSTLEFLFAKYRLYIVSLAIDDDIEGRFGLLDKFKIRQYFKFSLFHLSDKDTLFRNVAGNLNIPYNQIAIVDDRTIRGIKWGNSKGCLTVWLQKGKFASEHPNEETGEPNYIIKELSELKRIL